jgi:hypothetical protein
VLIGYVNDLDIYYEDQTEDGGFEYIFIVGPKDRKLRATDYNFDSFIIEGNRLMMDDQTDSDIHVGLDEMCLIYQLAVERGYIKAEEEGGIQE